MGTGEEHPGAELHAYLERQLSLEGTLLVEEHLAECKRCRIEFETLGALHRAVRSTRSRAATSVEPAAKEAAVVRSEVEDLKATIDRMGRALA